MFEKKDIIFSETLGVCQVAELTRLAAKNGEQILYYGLKSIADKKKVSYIPAEHHKVMLRPLITKEEALELKNGNPNELSKLQREEIEYVLSREELRKKPGKKAE